MLTIISDDYYVVVCIHCNIHCSWLLCKQKESTAIDKSVSSLVCICGHLVILKHTFTFIKLYCNFPSLYPCFLRSPDYSLACFCQIAPWESSSLHCILSLLALHFFHACMQWYVFFLQRGLLPIRAKIVLSIEITAIFGARAKDIQKCVKYQLLLVCMDLSGAWTGSIRFEVLERWKGGKVYGSEKITMYKYFI